MKTQLIVLLLVLLLPMLLNSGGRQMAWAYATAPNLSRNWASELYERAQLWFEKGLEEVEKAFDEGIKGLKGSVEGFKTDLNTAIDKKASKEDVEQIKKDIEEKAVKMQEQLDELQKAKDRINDRNTQKKSLLGAIEEKLTAGDFLQKAKTLPRVTKAKASTSTSKPCRSTAAATL